MKKFIHKKTYRMSFRKTRENSEIKKGGTFSGVLDAIECMQNTIKQQQENDKLDIAWMIECSKNAINQQQEISTFEICETGGDWFKDNFDEYLSQDLTDKYLAMVSGLDDKSKTIFDIILRRLMLAKQNDWKNILFRACSWEKQELAKIQDEFSNRVVPLNNGWYSYKEMLLPSSNFEPGIWYLPHS